MRAASLLLVAAILLAGCSDAPDEIPDGPANQAPIPAAPGSPSAEAQYQVVTLEEGTFSADAGTRCQPTLPTSAPVAAEDLIHEVLIPDGTRWLEASFVSTGQPQTVSPPSIKMYNPNQNLGGPAESEKQWSQGTIVFKVTNPAKGLWSFALHHCDVPTTGAHVLDSLITAEIPVN